jgi:predicted  nucleic acid-binding Zn-ribbon protein
MAESAKFSTKDIAQDILKKASPARLKFEEEKIMIDAVVLADDLKDHMEGKEWKKLEVEMEKDFDGQIKELIPALAKKVASADTEIASFPPGLYDNFLRPINIELEHKFVKYAERISSLLTSKLMEARKDLMKSKKGVSIKEPKVRVDFDFQILVSSQRRSISSSAAGAPVVKPAEASKEITPAADDCEASLKKVEAVEKEIRKAIIDAERAQGTKREDELKEGRKQIGAYRNGISDLGDKLRDLDGAINETQDKQELWKKRLASTKPTEKNYAEMKKAIDKVIGGLGELSKSCKKTRDEVTRDGADRIETLEKSIEALAQATVPDARLAAAIAPAKTSAPAFFREVADLLEHAKRTTGEVQSKLKELQKLAQAAAAK